MGDFGRRPEAGAVVELPGVEPVEQRRVLQCDRLAAAVRPQVDVLGLGGRLHTEDDAGEAAPAVHRHVHLDDAVLERGVGENRAAAQRGAAEVLDDGAGAAIPTLGVERYRRRGCEATHRNDEDNKEHARGSHCGPPCATDAIGAAR